MADILQSIYIFFYLFTKYNSLGSIYNPLTYIQLTAWCPTDDKSLSKPMVTHISDACVINDNELTTDGSERATENLITMQISLNSQSLTAAQVDETCLSSDDWIFFFKNDSWLYIEFSISNHFIILGAYHDRHSFSNHWPLDCLFSGLFRLTTKELPEIHNTCPSAVQTMFSWNTITIWAFLMFWKNIRLTGLCKRYIHPNVFPRMSLWMFQKQNNPD